MFYSYDRQQHLLKPSVKTPGEATYAPEPCFASVLPVPTAEELSFSHGERPPKAVVRYRILAYRRLLHHTVRNEAAIKLLQTLPDNMIVKMCIRYYLPEEQKCDQKE